MKANNKKMEKPNVGVFWVVHETYFGQFPELKGRLDQYYDDFLTIVKKNDVNLFDYGMVGTYDESLNALKKMSEDHLDVLFCDMITYATSMSFAQIVRNMKVPIVLVALQPLSAMDYSNACTQMQLENDNICSVPEFTYAANRLGNKVADVIIGKLYGDDYAQNEIAQWCKIAKVLHSLKGARIGLMGHVLEAMYDMHTDPTAVASAFGVHVPLLEIDDLLALDDNVSQSEIDEKVKLICDTFNMPDPESDPLTSKTTKEDLVGPARSAVILDKLIASKDLTGLAYYYEGAENSPHRAMATSLIVGNSLLVGNGVPMCGEYDLKTCIAMLIMDRLDIGGSFAEFHPLDFDEDFILVGHDGPHHIKIAEGKPVLRTLDKYHGKPGSGVSVEFKIKDGPITMLGITQNYDGSFKFVVGEGTSMHGPIPPTGNTNTRGFFSPNTKDFIKAWVMECPTHHYALGVGHHAKTIAKIGEALGIETVIVTVK